MTIWFVVALIAAVGFFAFKPAWRQFVLGQRLSNLTSIVETIEGTRATMPIGRGGGIDSLPPAQADAAARAFERGIVELRKVPRHVITRELLKNALLADRMGRPARRTAIERLLQALVSEGVALGQEEFLASYSR